MTSRAPDPLLAVARGLAVFPIPPGGNTPKARGWQHCATRDVELIHRTWRPGDNVGIGCRASGVVGLDLDVADGRHNTDVAGVDTLAALCAEHGQPVPQSLTIRTPSTGKHLFLRVPPGWVIPSSSGGKSGLGPGIDVRAPGQRSGGYLIGLDSIVDGTRYVLEHDLPIADLPEWMALLLGMTFLEVPA